MCGICGVVQRRALDEQSIRAVRAMNAAMAHRGPDSAGEHVGAQVMLAMRRLSIIDLAGASQPLWNEDRTLALVANGEIYNFKELRDDLARRGHRFATDGDCETILHLYEERGVECVDALRGMFAFALWDSVRERLLLVRDRLGEKPLYVAAPDGQLLFASELRSLLASRMVPFELDPVSVDQYFHFQFVPEPRTPVLGVRKLDAGCRLVVDLKPWRVAEERYWDPEAAPPIEGDPVQLLREQLEAVSELVVRSDVPVGVALSGGLDSSTIAAFAAKKYPGRLHAFTVGYSGRPHHDEREMAQRFAAHLGIPCHEIELTTAQITDTFPELVWDRDDPIADISGHGYHAVARRAREQGVPVLLQGQGGDELFWGYPWLRKAVAATQLKQKTDSWGWLTLPLYLRFASPSGWARWQIRQWLEGGCGLLGGWRRFQDVRRLPASRYIFYDLNPDYQEAARKLPGLYGRDFAERLCGRQSSELFTFDPPVRDVEIRATTLIMSSYLRENGMAQGDRLSMASSVELRLPLLDYRLVETVIGLRKRYRDVHLAAKQWLRDAVKNDLPDWVLDRPKRGFQPPVREWYESLFARYGALLESGCLVRAGVLTADAGKRMAFDPIPYKTVTPLMFKALTLELWCGRAKELAGGQLSAVRQEAAGGRSGTLSDGETGRNPSSETGFPTLQPRRPEGGPKWLLKGRRWFDPLLPVRILYYPLRRRLRRTLAGREGRRVYALLARMRQDPLANFRGYRDEKLRGIIRYAYRHCPYYREIFDRCGVRPDDLDTFSRIPLLDKPTIRRRFAEVCSDRLYDMPRYRMNTGGSTGEPLEFPLHSLAGRIDWVHQEYRHCELFGWKPEERIVGFGGIVVPEELRQRKIYWMEREWGQVPYGHLMFSSLYLTEKTVEHYVRHMIECRPAIIRGYPSAISRVAEYMLRENLKPLREIRAVDLTAENAFDWQIESIRAALGARVYLQYGHSEVSVYAFTEDESREYLCSPFYGLVEVLGPDGKAVGVGESGEVVATGFYNRAMPFIRYRTGDVAIYGGEERGIVRLRKIVGRTQDYIYNADGSRVALTAVVFGQHFAAFARIRKWQLVQNEPGRIQVHVIPAEGFGEADAAEIKRRFESSCGVVAEVRTVEDVAMTPRGKSMFLIQNLPGPSEHA